MHKIFFDHQASTPVHPSVFEAMRPYFTEKFGNPASLHMGGVAAREALDKARAQCAAFIGAESPENILFTSSGTEALNLALKGCAYAQARQGRHLIVSAIEHPALLNSAAVLEKDGFAVTRARVDGEGRVDAREVMDAVREDTILIAVQHANHDIGTMQPIEEIGRFTAERGIHFLVDCTASAGWRPINLAELQATLLVFAPHRFYGPKGVGVLYRHRSARLHPVLHGGIQEFGLRPGTENVPAIVGAGAAAELARVEVEARGRQAGELQAALWRELATAVPYIRLNGPSPGPGRHPATLNFCVEFVEGEGLVLGLDLKGIAVASGPSCVSKALKIPPVLQAIGVDATLAVGNLMVSFGPANTRQEVSAFMEAFAAVVERQREFSPLWEDFQKGRRPSAITGTLSRPAQ